MYSYTSQISTTTQFAQDLGSDAVLTFTIVAGIVLAIGMLSIGVAFAWRQVQKRALGKKL
jgi:diacylglycerol kinase